MNIKMEYFLLGMIGALAPEIVRLWKLATAGQKFALSWSYLGVSIAFAVLGGVVVLVLGSSNALEAFYTGIGTPLVISTAVKHGTVTYRNRKAGPSPATPDPQKPSRLDAFLGAL